MGSIVSFTVLGLFTGAAYAIAASGLVLTYTTTRVFNIAHGAFGMVMAFVFWDFSVRQGLPVWLSLVLVLGVVATAVLLTVGGFLFDADFGSLPAVAALVLCACTAGTSVMFLIVRLVRTAEQAGVATSIVALVLGIAGGAFFPISSAGSLTWLLDLNPVAAMLRGLGITAGAVTQLVDRLREAGLVEQAPHPHDARSRVIRLSSIARAEVDVFEGGVIAEMRRHFGGLSDADIVQLGALLSRVGDDVGAGVTRPREE